MFLLGISGGTNGWGQAKPASQVVQSIPLEQVTQATSPQSRDNP
ncbi:hypothetical protein AVDCRST_MAG81-5432 [uncultured Synechococcales cyanobacterium]|uniref:Uncharacterized protein n=1 Tax=uncultured Synechococcales cyanobacterium TaxID=1936017 RepID=A0A6J4VVE2_9CYAN|nr:hypothetical protein AVDCRST_MAG81-5432 [uncultured Synechococcales cyanobacterium]